MNSISSKVILKKLLRIKDINKHTYKIIIDISKGITEVRPVYKVPDKLTIIDVFDKLIQILIKLNINFVVSNTAKRSGRIGILVTIKTKVNTNGNNTAKIRAPN